MEDMHKAKLAPSILNANFANLGGLFHIFERHPSVGYIHFDVMDGDFVPNVSFGAPVVRSLAAATKLPFDVHLMVMEPGRFVSEYVTDNTEYITVHAEATKHLDSTLRLVRSLGVKCGVALNPATPPEALDFVLDIVDQVLVMGVNPGFGGQMFIPSTLLKIRRLAQMREERGLGFKIAIDGGMLLSNILDAVGAGAEIVTVGSAIVKAPDPDAVLTAFDELLGGRE